MNGQLEPQAPPMEEAPQGQQAVPAVQGAATGNTEELSPAVQKEMEAYRTILNKILHPKDTRTEVLGMLESGDMEMAVPMAALQIDKMAADSTGGKVSTEARLGGGVYIVSELIELGMASGYWPQPTEEEAQLVFQDTLQDYVEVGLKDGTIDPIELQQGTEGLLNPEQSQMGMQMGQEFDIPNQGSPHQAVYNAKQQEQGQAPPPVPQGGAAPP